MSNLVNRSYAATEADVASVTKQYLSAVAGQGEARSTYLRILIGTLQSEFESDAPVAKRVAPTEVTAPQLKLLETIHQRFYAVVMRVVTETPFESDGRDKNKARHRRGIFARTSASALRSWIRSGRDVRALDVERVTKATLAVKKPDKEADLPASPAKRLVAMGERIADLATDMATSDKAAATHTLEAILTRLTQSLMDLGNRATTKPSIALASHRPFRTSEGIFWPVAAPNGAPREQRAETS